MPDPYNYQMIIIDTMRGRAKTKKEIEDLWNERLAKLGSHYRVVSVILRKGQGDKE